MTLRSALAAPLVLLSTLAPAAAQNLVFDCDFPSGPDWVRGPIQATIGPDGTGQATGFVIDHFVGGPVPAEVVVDNDRRWTIRYQVEDARDDSAQNISRLVYRLTVQKAGGAAALGMVPAGYSNSFQNNGACQVGRG